MKVALTGSNGFLGSHIVKEYLDDNHEVIALVRPSADIKDFPTHPSLQIEKVDYGADIDTQFATLKKKHGTLDLFIHNAGVTVSLNAKEYFQINTKLTGAIVSAVEESEWVKKEGKLVYISSLTAQGPVGINKPVSNYAESKLQAESFFKQSPYPALIIRPTAIYGAGDYAFLPLIKGANQRVYPLTNKNQKMSMIHGKDLARLVRIEAENSTGILHASDGKTYLHSDFILALSRVVGKKINVIPVAPTLSKLILGLSDLGHKVVRKRPSITREKFLEISLDWNQHEYKEIDYSNVPCEISLEEGFKDAFDFYRSKKLL